MTKYAVPLSMIIGVLIMIIAFLIAIGVLVFKLIKNHFGDYIIMLDKGNRFAVKRVYLGKKDTFTMNKQKYFLLPDALNKNRFGRSLGVYSIGKPAPMRLEYDKSSWLTSDSLQSIIHNQQVQEVVRAAAKGKDTFILLGAIGGLVAGLASCIILLIQMGVINIGT